MRNRGNSLLRCDLRRLLGRLTLLAPVLGAVIALQAVGTPTTIASAAQSSSVCGDGSVEGSEACDEGSGANGNGTAGSCCSASCTFVPEGTECRSADGQCDIAETCNGTDALCPVDLVKGDNVTCREPAGSCDLREKCDGINPTCPADVIKESGTRCRKATDVCDAVERCDGASTDCPADELEASGTVCRESLGGCDPAETCDGSANTCPADALSPEGTECRSSADAQCDIAEECTGAVPTCGTDLYVADGTGCDDGDPATEDETCLLGFCACTGGDLDSDGTTDNCDNEDASLQLIQLKVQEAGNKPGRYSAKGFLPVGVFGNDDVFNPAESLRIVLRAGSSFEAERQFTPEQCTTKNTSFVCRNSKDESKARARFSARYVDGTLDGYKFKLSIRDVPIPAGVTAPFEVSMRTRILDRSGTIATCLTKKKKTVCKDP